MYTSTLYREVYTLLASNKDWCGRELDRISPSDFRRAVNNIYKELVTDGLSGLPENAKPTHGELSQLVGRHEHSKRYLDELLVSIDRVQGAPNPHAIVVSRLISELGYCGIYSYHTRR